LKISMSAAPAAGKKPFPVPFNWPPKTSPAGGTGPDKNREM
jgi:hypothetical protein